MSRDPGNAYRPPPLNRGRPGRFKRLPYRPGRAVNQAPDPRAEALVGAWAGKTAVVIASGPSLTAEDVYLVAAYRALHPCVVLVTNTSFRAAPWADVLFFHDWRWWEVHQAEVKRSFPGLKVTIAASRDPAVISLAGLAFDAYLNAGGGAISLALLGGCQRVICLGLDAQVGPQGQTHWHGSHPKPCGDAVSLPIWAEKFADLARVAQARGVPVLNASRTTALDCFPRVTLEEVL